MRPFADAFACFFIFAHASVARSPSFIEYASRSGFALRLVSALPNRASLHPRICAPFFCASVFGIVGLARTAQKAATTSSLSFAGRIAKPLRGGGGAAPVPSGPTPISGGGAASGSPLARLQNEEGYVPLTLRDGSPALTSSLTLCFFPVLRPCPCTEPVSSLFPPWWYESVF